VVTPEPLEIIITQFSGHHPIVKRDQVRKIAIPTGVRRRLFNYFDVLLRKVWRPLANDNERTYEYDNGYRAVGGW